MPNKKPDGPWFDGARQQFANQKKITKKERKGKPFGGKGKAGK